MRRILILFPVFTILVGNCASPNKDPYRFEGEKHLRNLRKLTHGGENAEAYFSFDETKLIFQATRGGLGCDQIFVMNTDGSNVRMVSTGKGRTTCAYFLPGDTTFIYASTHLADENCPEPPDYSRGYVWKLYDTYDIFLARLSDGKILKRLTDTPGYDAEATVSPTGDKIVFTSMRDGDPEIYVMDLDGSNQRRLTYEKGYDGGPFFSWDGKKIVFRASRPTTPEGLEDYEALVKEGLVRPTVLEIYVMDADGSNIRQVTHFGKASFAPLFHPDGKRIIFSSNVYSKDPRNFDLYIINIDGTGLERITYFEGFDGFPMFTRDGKHLVFASNRFNSQENETNIFIADWID
jgi:Tol biopolymer transport system component